MNLDNPAPGSGTHTGDQLCVEDIDSYIVHMRKDIAELSEKVKRLPKIDARGHSECPFAEALYAQKEEATKKFIEYRSKLNGYMSLINHEIERFRQNLNRLSMDTHTLGLPQARERYETAKSNYEFHYHKNVRRSEALQELSKQADEVLMEAQAKKWPMGTPQKQYSYPTFPLAGITNDSRISDTTSPSTRSSGAKNGFQNEIESLLALGPL